jgi:hypothetical protein
MSLREHHRHLTKIIKRAGWACQSVSSSADELGPNWMHTIGIEAFGQPELIVVGMPEPNALDLLNAICRDATLGNRPWPQPGDIMFHSCGDAARVAVLEVDDDLITAGEWFNMATYRRANGTHGFRAIQLVWSDQHGQLPTITTEQQPLLGDPWWTAA